MALGPAVIDNYISTFDIAVLAQALTEGGRHGRILPRRRVIEKPNHRHRLLLRPRRERPRCSRASEKRDELAPPHHSITLSARSRSGGGIARPIAFAVCRLTASSNLVGCSIGKSAGWAPRSTLSTKTATRR